MNEALREVAGKHVSQQGSNVNDEVLKKFSNLRILSTRSSGYGHIDIQEIKCI